ncbi:uncharacterized protein Z520_03109 [Fonsecaea multimorphosa CBS 102226]|uniref:Uncharacterized protein n=1 Tax=Fonsecaea multimorphosa CBS 102226 TaxID=1442371 RepID=A0A0D2IX20_9EURO|nr:uncharacterized protein Z520_03109 [Fonsecaea multimorphosa CBS 102226]KIY01557.1 hypothetical protein Z520_03109 [Fonsecaea multimorphosa CBS 102226]
MGDITHPPGDDDALRLPVPAPNQVYVKVSALNGGFLTLPERNFVTDPDPEKGTTVPSMCFLIEHREPSTSKLTRVVFDLGIKRDLTRYAQPATQHHITTRQPVYSSADARSSLMSGGLDPARDIDYVILSHIHWDHIGLPSDYPNSTFVVGSGTLYILENGAPHYPLERIEKGALPASQTTELPPVPDSDRKHMAATTSQTKHTWTSISTLPHAVDFFGDGSLWIIDAPGHIHGHVNALLRVGPEKWVYLGGDCCHDRRIMTGEKQILEYDNGQGKLKSAHAELHKARKTIQNVQRLIEVNGEAVEWIVAHDWKWASENQNRFFPRWMY